MLVAIYIIFSCSDSLCWPQAVLSHCFHYKMPPLFTVLCKVSPLFRILHLQLLRIPFHFVAPSHPGSTNWLLVFACVVDNHCPTCSTDGCLCNLTYCTTLVANQSPSTPNCVSFPFKIISTSLTAPHILLVAVFFFHLQPSLQLLC